MRKRSKLPILLLTGLAAILPAAPATARVIEVGKTEQMPAPSCPDNPCQAVSRTSGYQVKAGADAGLFKVPASGRVVAWTISLGAPAKEQQAFFEDRLGGEASAGITVIRPGGKQTTGRVVARGPVKKLTRYFGRTVQFPLVQSLPVRKGDVVALTVPTWSPSLALELGRDSSWRATRSNKPRSRCLDTAAPTAKTRVGAVARFECRYPTARLTYSATMVTAPPRVR